jgi:DNA repair protein RadC
MAIYEWPVNARPRERLLKHGAEYLSDEELLAIFLRTGTRAMDAVRLARHLLQTFGSLAQLCKASEADFCAIPGLGPARFTQLKAMLEITKRASQEVLIGKEILGSSAAVKQYLLSALRFYHEEIVLGLFLNNRYEMICSEILSKGSFNHVNIYVREIIRRALHHGAGGLIIAHNHPSGTAKASEADITVTHHLQQALQLVDVQLVDHFIIAGEQIISFIDLELLL